MFLFVEQEVLLEKQLAQQQAVQQQFLLEQAWEMVQEIFSLYLLQVLFLYLLQILEEKT